MKSPWALNLQQYGLDRENFIKEQRQPEHPRARVSPQLCCCCDAVWGLTHVLMTLTSLKMTKLGELKQHFQWKTGLKFGHWAPSNLEIPQLHGRASGRDLPHFLPVPWLFIFIFSTNQALKSSNSTLRCCASARTTAVIKKGKEVCCLLSHCGGFCMVRAEQSEAMFCAGIFFFKRRF